MLTVAKLSGQTIIEQNYIIEKDIFHSFNLWQFFHLGNSLSVISHQNVSFLWWCNERFHAMKPFSYHFIGKKNPFRMSTKHSIKVAEHSFNSLWSYVICKIMARERLQLTSWNLESEKYTDERFWLTGKMWRFRSFHGNMNDWIQP